MVLEHGSTLGLDGWNVDCHACMKVVCVLIMYAWWWPLLQLCCHVGVDDVVVGICLS